TIGLAIAVLTRHTTALLATSQEAQAGNDFQPAMIARRQPEGQQPEHRDCFQPVHALKNTNRHKMVKTLERDVLLIPFDLRGGWPELPIPGSRSRAASRCPRS